MKYLPFLLSFFWLATMQGQTSGVIGHGGKKHTSLNNTFGSNAKSASPTGIGPYGKINTEVDEFVYHIQFQNLSADTAFRVYITDTLDPILNPSSLIVTSTSHAYTLFQLNGAVRFYFNDIALPDSATNFQESQGHITYRISPKYPLQVGEQIKNTAYIYFNFNDALATNTVLHTVVDQLTDLPRIDAADERFTIMPNPFTNRLTIEMARRALQPKRIKLELMNSAGQSVFQFMKTISQTLEIDLPPLPRGFYFYHIKSAEQHAKLLQTGKLIATD